MTSFKQKLIPHAYTRRCPSYLYVVQKASCVVIPIMSCDVMTSLPFTCLKHSNFVCRSAPIVVGLAVYFMWQIIGPACMAGFAFMIIILPLNSMAMASVIRKFQVYK